MPQAAKIIFDAESLQQLQDLSGYRQQLAQQWDASGMEADIEEWLQGHREELFELAENFHDLNSENQGLLIWTLNQIQ
jgi:hypothetical protein